MGAFDEADARAKADQDKLQSRALELQRLSAQPGLSKRELQLIHEEIYSVTERLKLTQHECVQAGELRQRHHERAALFLEPEHARDVDARADAPQAERHHAQILGRLQQSRPRRQEGRPRGGASAGAAR